jgi:hypothetical protein
LLREWRTVTLSLSKRGRDERYQPSSTSRRRFDKLSVTVRETRSPATVVGVEAL